MPARGLSGTRPSAAPSGCTQPAASRRPTAARGSSPRRTPSPAERAERRASRCVLTTGRVAAPVAHDDAHRQAPRTARRRARAVRRAAPGRRAARRRRRRRARCCCARAAGARPCARGSTDRVAEGVAFAPFHWGALHLEPGAGALNARRRPGARPDLPPGRAEGDAMRIEPVVDAENPCMSPVHASGGGARRRWCARARAGAGWSSSAAGWPGWRPSRRCSATRRRRAGRSRSSGAEPDAPYDRVLLSSAARRGGRRAELALRHRPVVRSSAASALRARRCTCADSTPRRARSARRRRDARRLRRPRPGDRLAAVRPADPGRWSWRGVHVFRTLRRRARDPRGRGRRRAARSSSAAACSASRRRAACASAACT